MKTPELGTIIHATMRPEDLIPAFMDALKEYNPERVVHFGDVDFDDIEQWVEDHPEEASWTLEDLFNYLEEVAPPFCYFGSKEGDGSDYGFWLSTDSVEQARVDGELPSGGEIPDPSTVKEGQFLQVSDHGNATLYVLRPQWFEAWGIV